MKKRYLLPLFVVAAMASQAGAVEMCLWNQAGDCWKIDGNRAACIKDAWLFDGGEEGEGTMCSGGTFIDGKTSTPPSGSPSVSIGCCRWDTDLTKCYDVYTQGDVDNCTGDSQFYSGACPDKQGGCPGSTPGSSSGGGTSSGSGGGHCKDPNKGNNQGLYCGYSTGCYKVQNEYSDAGTLCSANSSAKGCEPCSDKIAACEKDGGLYVGVREAALNDGNGYGDDVVCANEGGTQVGGSSPIRRLSFAATNNIVKVIHNGINLQLTSNAKIQIYDLKGKMARSFELAQGSYNVELSALPHGIYIVKVTGNSWKQTITVPLK